MYVSVTTVQIIYIFNVVTLGYHIVPKHCWVRILKDLQLALWASVELDRLLLNVLYLSKWTKLFTLGIHQKCKVSIKQQRINRFVPDSTNKQVNSQITVYCRFSLMKLAEIF
jgi:hypothetical protein